MKQKVFKNLFCCTPWLYSRFKKGESAPAGTTLKSPISGCSWPVSIPQKWRVHFEGTEKEITDIMKNMLPFDWCTDLLRNIVQENSRCPATDGECTVYTEMNRFSPTVNAESIRDLVAGTRLLTSLLYLKTNGRESHLRTVQYLHRVYQGSTFATPSLDTLLRSFVTKAIRLATYMTWKVFDIDGTNDTHIQLHKEYSFIKKTDREMTIVSSEQSWRSFLDKKSSQSKNIWSFVKNDKQINEFQVKKLEKVDELKIGIIGINSAELNFVRTQNYFTRQDTGVNITGFDNVIKFMLNKSESRQFCVNNFVDLKL